ncbi:MAG: isoleucine--tRNA ligase [Candidatus Firestonebacteria bacterium RIFOXYC2_FULL_39_67]|nr:MAG: isoleucine--tRNA ligase [Candidatus Firestonebacteria bacterium RIFOXYD2_FULL_39_29]OGF53997.1 MAG: isoleucine--tRNA ligase [Candidatus Firestonebacteria bacterium RifOxyC12_full_39_7]OGF54269.1 MAG: isoleucine--tRNA ligase [Candidatus Firestonebacteria bacterium RIFOXYC2_FULL_39_67]
MDYSKTINLPNTSFPMKAGLPQREPVILDIWDKEKLYELIREKRAGNEKFILHDGPPYANGDIHVGTALNKVLKDMVIKYKTMKGFDSPYIPGWDCHGMPIEHKVTEKHKIEHTKEGLLKFRGACRDYALKYVEIQKKQFKRLGILGEWEKPYLSLDHNYEAAIVGTFARLVKEGYIYKGLRPVLWCMTHKTALADAEVEYADETSPTVYVKFLLKNNIKNICPETDGKKVSLLIWTTTPWTLPSNLAICLNPDIDYAVVKIKDEYIILAANLVNTVLEKAKITGFTVVKTGVKGAVLEKLKYFHPFMGWEGLVILGGHVTDQDGTGCVHTAPGHGEDDFFIAKKYGIAPLSPLDDAGRFTSEVKLFEGKKVFEADPLVIELLKEKGVLLYEEKIIHSYPHCWRCRKPVIFRTTEQWFLNVEHKDLRKKMIAAAGGVKWYPAVGENRLKGMLESRPDWCLSRQRYWGVPIPVIYCEKCFEPVLEEGVLSKITGIIGKEGSEAWFSRETSEFLPEKYTCKKCGSSEFKKDTNILDVWFDSSCSHFAVLKNNPKLDWPCEMYLEGSDQHRGWFQVSLITAMALEGKPSFKNVLTHGYVVDGEGKKMSKSLGNLITGEEACKKYGADIVRLWVAASDYTDDIRFSDEILARLMDAYRKIRNTARYLISNLYDYRPGEKDPSYEQLTDLDKYMLHRLEEVIKESTGHYDEYEFYKFYQAIYNFCVVDLSSFYMDILKDRLYVNASDSIIRKGSQFVMYRILTALTKMTAPVLVYTSEEIWQELRKIGVPEKSVHASDWPVVSEKYINNEIKTKYEKIIALRSETLKLLEVLRNTKVIGHPYEAKVVVNTASDGDFMLYKQYEKELPGIFIVSQVEVIKADKNLVEVKKADGVKCERCWNFSATVGKDSAHASLCERCVTVLKETKQY